MSPSKMSKSRELDHGSSWVRFQRANSCPSCGGVDWAKCDSGHSCWFYLIRWFAGINHWLGSFWYVYQELRTLLLFYTTMSILVIVVLLFHFLQVKTLERSCTWIIVCTCLHQSFYHGRYGGASGKSEKVPRVESCCGREPWAILSSNIYTHGI